MRSHSIRAYIFLVVLSQLARSQEFEVPRTNGIAWFKGNTHTHTTMSDGDSSPEEVVRWYRSHGYQFLVLSDHDTLTDPRKQSVLIDSSFLLIPGEEVSSSFRKKPVHVNGLNISRAVSPQADSTLLGTIQKNVDAVRNANGAPHINHPNFGWALDQATMAEVKNNNLLEIFNGHPSVHNFGGSGKPGLEEVWDYVLTSGKRMYGIAVDDAHNFNGEFAPNRSNPGRGWVVVKASRLDAEEIIKNLEAGHFYASTGVELEDVTVEPRQMEIRIKQKSNFGYRTEFIGAGGRVLLRTENNPAVFELKEGEKYVRAKVRDSAGYVAWVQPVFVKVK